MSWEGPEPERDEDRPQLTEGERLTVLINSWITEANEMAYDLQEEAEHEQLRKCARELREVIRAR